MRTHLARHSLEWILKNNGSPGTFTLSQKSSYGVVGRILNPSVFLHSGNFVRVKVDDIKLPAYPSSDLVFTLLVNKESPSSEEREVFGPGYKDSAQSSVIFNVVERTFQEETESPVGNVWLSESGCGLVEFCQQAYWLAQFTAMDLNSGMFRVELKSVQDTSHLYWWHSQFQVIPITSILSLQLLSRSELKDM